jgi:hypothetical protein
VTLIYDSGDRTGEITVTASPGLIANGSPSNLVNGLKGQQGAVQNIAFAAVALNSSRWLQWAFTEPQESAEASWYGESSGVPSSQGTWQFYRSTDLTNWTAAGNPFELFGKGFNTAHVIDMSAVGAGFLGLKMVGVSGNTNPGLWQAEINFKRIDSSAPPPPPSGQKPLAIFLFSGQSNSEGQAPNPDQSVYANRARISNFALDGSWKPAADPLMDTAGSIWPVLNNVNGPATSPAMSFSNTMAPLLKNFDLGVVVSAKGSTSMDQWAFSTDPATLCGAAMQRAQQALTEAPAGSFIAGFIWQQGENETLSEANCLTWKTKLDALLAAIRGHLGLVSLPVAVIGLGPNPEGSIGRGWAVLSGIQKFMTIAAPSTVVFTADLPNAAGADWTNTSSVIEIGKRAANQMRVLLPHML